MTQSLPSLHECRTRFGLVVRVPSLFVFVALNNDESTMMTVTMTATQRSHDRLTDRGEKIRGVIR